MDLLLLQRSPKGALLPFIPFIEAKGFSELDLAKLLHLEGKMSDARGTLPGKGTGLLKVYTLWGISSSFYLISACSTLHNGTQINSYNRYVDTVNILLVC